MYWSPFSNTINTLLFNLELIQDIYISNHDEWASEILIIKDDDFHIIQEVDVQEMLKIIFPHDLNVNYKTIMELLSSSDYNNNLLAIELIDTCDILKHIDSLYNIFININNNHDTILNYKDLIIKLHNIIHKF